jgi:hypothetical protein
MGQMGKYQLFQNRHLFCSLVLVYQDWQVWGESLKNRKETDFYHSKAESIGSAFFYQLRMVIFISSPNQKSLISRWKQFFRKAIFRLGPFMHRPVSLYNEWLNETGRKIYFLLRQNNQILSVTVY